MACTQDWLTKCIQTADKPAPYMWVCINMHLNSKPYTIISITALQYEVQTLCLEVLIMHDKNNFMRCTSVEDLCFTDFNMETVILQILILGRKQCAWVEKCVRYKLLASKTI